LSISSKTLLIKNLNSETQNKATPVGSTVLTLMSLLNGEIIKIQVRLLPVHFKLSHVYQYYKLYINITNELFQALFYHINKWTHHCYHWTGHQPTIVTTQAKARLFYRSGRCTPINDRTSDMSSSIRVSLSDNNWQILFQLYHISLFLFE